MQRRCPHTKRKASKATHKRGSTGTSARTVVHMSNDTHVTDVVLLVHEGTDLLCRRGRMSERTGGGSGERGRQEGGRQAGRGVEGEVKVSGQGISVSGWPAVC